MVGRLLERDMFNLKIVSYLFWDGYINIRSFDLSAYFYGDDHKTKEEIGYIQAFPLLFITWTSCIK